MKAENGGRGKSWTAAGVKMNGEPLPYQTNAEMIIDEHITGKIDDWEARKLLNRVLSCIREKIKYPAFKTIEDKIKADRTGEVDRIKGYLEIIEKKIRNAKNEPIIQEPDNIIELRDKAGKLELGDNGKYNIRGKKSDFLRYCAFAGFLDDLTLSKNIFNRWVNHGYTPGSLNKLWMSAIKWANEMNQKNEETYSKACIAADMMDKIKR